MDANSKSDASLELLEEALSEAITASRTLKVGSKEYTDATNAIANLSKSIADIKRGDASAASEVRKAEADANAALQRVKVDQERVEVDKRKVENDRKTARTETAKVVLNGLLKTAEIGVTVGLVAKTMQWEEAGGFIRYKTATREAWNALTRAIRNYI